MRDEKEGLSSSLIPLPSSLALLRKSALWLLMVSLPVAVLTSALAPLAIHLVFGPRYAAAAPVLAIGIWRVPATGLSLLTGYSLLAVKRQDLELRTGAAGTVISLALVVLLVHYYGALGGAIAVAEVEGKGAIDLFERERVEAVYDAFRRQSFQEGIHHRI